MRCLFTHNWVMGEAFDVKSFSPWRKCKRCGRIQRGTYDKVRKDMTWETIRERVYSKSKHAQIVRRPSSGLEQLAHTLRLRRTRKSDRRRQGHARQGTRLSRRTFAQARAWAAE